MLTQQHIMSLPLSARQVTYVWIGGNKELRSKCRTIFTIKPLTLKDIPAWDYDGSSTKQATSDNSEILLKPQAVFGDPFRHGGYLVMCDTYKPNWTPHPTNQRVGAEAIFNQKLDEEPWFGIEQEFFFFNKKKNKPASFDETEKYGQGQFYCSVGASNCYQRPIMEVFYRAALYAGLKISGINAESSSITMGISSWSLFGC